MRSSHQAQTQQAASLADGLEYAVETLLARSATNVMQHVRTELGKIAAQLLKQAPEEDAPALAWSVVAGSVVAGRTRVLEREGGVLRIEARDAGWRAELAGLEPQYRSAINHLLKQPVARILFVAPQRKPARNPDSSTRLPRRARS